MPCGKTVSGSVRIECGEAHGLNIRQVVFGRMTRVRRGAAMPARHMQKPGTRDVADVIHACPRLRAPVTAALRHAESCGVIEADGNGNECTFLARPVAIFGNCHTKSATGRVPALS